MANQELGLINMATVQKRQAPTVLNDLINRGVTSEQIVQLINFAGEWDRYWTTAKGNGNLQQPIATNGYGGNLSMNDLIRLKSTTERATNMLNRMGTTH